jgi:hypothetical protein
MRLITNARLPRPFLFMGKAIKWKHNGCSNVASKKRTFLFMGKAIKWKLVKSEETPMY